jgi:hypothetical protein
MTHTTARTHPMHPTTPTSLPDILFLLHPQTLHHPPSHHATLPQRYRHLPTLHPAIRQPRTATTAQPTRRALQHSLRHRTLRYNSTCRPYSHQDKLAQHRPFRYLLYHESHPVVRLPCKPLPTSLREIDRTTHRHQSTKYGHHHHHRHHHQQPGLAPYDTHSLPTDKFYPSTSTPTLQETFLEHRPLPTQSNTGNQPYSNDSQLAALLPTTTAQHPIDHYHWLQPPPPSTQPLISLIRPQNHLSHSSSQQRHQQTTNLH